MWWLRLAISTLEAETGGYHCEFKADWAISEWQVWLTLSTKPDGLFIWFSFIQI